MSSRPFNRGWLWIAVVLTAVKLWLVSGQRIYAIGPSFHDDLLFVRLAEFIANGQWLGPYDQYTLAKGPMYSFFIAAAFKLGVPLILAQQLLYVAACATLTWSLRPWLRSGAAWFACYVLLLWNPMSYEAEHLGRVLRQNIYTPLALFAVAGLVTLFVHRRDTAPRQAIAGGLAGLAFSCFWLTREESIWLVPAIGLLLAAPALSLRRELAQRWRALAAGVGSFVLLAVLPLLFISTMNYRHYGWFGAVEFRATEFKDAFGSLLRLQTGPQLQNVAVTRQMREKAYELSPEFARIRSSMEGAVGEHWADGSLAPPSERQIRGGWFMWALRDAVNHAGVAPNAGEAMRFYRKVADELNAACEAGRVDSLPRRSGFLPPLKPEMIKPVIDESGRFIAFFFLFQNFTAYAPDSVGDYQDLKPFRNIVGTRLTPSERSPVAPTPEQDRRDAWKLSVLQSIGDGLVAVLRWLGPLLLVVGLAHGVESALARRVSFPLWLAGAVLFSCVGYLAINVLVQVTSFYNMSPAAVAPAYALYLLALVGIVVDAVAAWRRANEEPASAPPSSVLALAQPFPLAWLAATGVAVTIFGARLAEIHLFASDVPYNDQWVIEAQQIIAPWLNGTLGLGDFFVPHFEHLPVWTRLLAWLQVAITGRWDPLVQMTTNAAIYAAFAWCVARWTWSVLRPVPAAAISLLLLLAGCLPHAWENIAWGFQSQFPLALLAGFIHVHGCCTQPSGSRGWWLAQAAGLAGLLTIASFWLAPLAVVLAWGWTGPRRRADLVVPGVLAAAGAMTLLVIHFSVANSFTQGTASALERLHSALHLLAWPSLLPGAVALIQLPWAIHALRLRRQADATPVDRMILILGLWNLLQAASLAFGRVGDSNDFVSRYGDLLFLGTLAGAGALARLTPVAGPTRRLTIIMAVSWGAIATGGLVRNSTAGHANYFHLYAADQAELRRTAIQTYLADGNRTAIDASSTRNVLFYDSELVTSLLDQPKFRALLPASVNPASARNPAGDFVRSLQARWPVFLVGGLLVLLGTASVGSWRRLRADPLPPLAFTDDPWRWRIAGVIGGAALLTLLVWFNPFAFASDGWQRWLGGDQAIKGMTFRFTTPSPFGPERMQGAAPITPEALRNHFFGTAPAGPELTCTAVSSPFVITKPWLIVPYGGYPVSNGNGIRVRLLDSQDQKIGEEIGCPGPNVDQVAFWAADVREHVGKRAQIILYDGRTNREAWVAASPPVPADSPDLSLTLAQGLRSESHAAIRVALFLIALAGLTPAYRGWLQRK